MQKESIQIEVNKRGILRKVTFFILGAMIVLALLLIALLAMFRQKLVEPNNALQESILFEVKEGASVPGVAAELQNVNVINDQRIFLYASKIFLKNLRPGFYEIEAKSSVFTIISLIQSGKTKTVKITFPEGWRIEQIAKRLSDNKIVSYAEFVEEARGLEGKLFPDTYIFFPRMSAEDVIAKMRADYEGRTLGLNVTDQDLIIASIVERESGNDQDRALIAGIYLNRIKIGMKLQSDPTVEYGRDTNAIAKLSAEDQQSYHFWNSAKTVEFTSVISSFNTYLSKNLPPTPICNPGMKSIQAAQNPESSSYYYFLYGKDGKIHPAKTQAEHEANVAKYM